MGLPSHQQTILMFKKFIPFFELEMSFQGKQLMGDGTHKGSMRSEKDLGQNSLFILRTKSVVV